VVIKKKMPKRPVQMEKDVRRSLNLSDSHIYKLFCVRGRLRFYHTENM
jgi:hypothetical protein